MEITKFTESGCNNTLMWAISNGADIKSDTSLQEIINSELFYLITFSNVNFLELFRLTQNYRDHVRIVDEHAADIPSKAELMRSFPGTIAAKDDPETKTNAADLAEFAINGFVNLALQMETDSDIIRPNMPKLFLPMISRKFDVQIPISFVDLIQRMSADESNKVFNENYPNTLKEVLNPEGSIYKMMELGFLNSTHIVKYNQRSEKYISYVKYAPLNACTIKDRLYKISLLGFHKYDNVSRGEVRCSLFNPNKDAITAALRSMGRLKTDLEVDFVIQLPIQYMQHLEYKFGSDMLAISYESSMSSIIDGGLIFNDFVAPELTDEALNGDGKAKEHNNAISAYRTRLTEANQYVLNCIQTIITADNDVDYTALFAMLPSMYMTKAVITIKADKLSEMISSANNEVVSEMLSEAEKIAAKIVSDIDSANA